MCSIANAGFPGDGQKAVGGACNNNEPAYRHLTVVVGYHLREEMVDVPPIKRQINFISLKPERMRKNHHYDKGKTHCLNQI